MSIVKLKIEKDDNLVKYISLIRKFDKSLSIGEIKKRIENHDYVIKHNLFGYDICDDMNGIDKNKLFRNLIDELIKKGADIEIYNNDRAITIDIFDNILISVEEIGKQTEIDMYNEAEE